LNREPAFEPRNSMLEMSKKDWEDITEDVFQKIFEKSPVKRTKFIGIKRNISFLKDCSH
jgi:epoxyqueuosine reductase